MSTKFPKTRLKEALDKIKKFGATWEWKSTPLGNGRYSATCEFYREAGFPSITGTGEGQGLKKAEHAAALQILNTLEIQFDFQNSSPSQNESPQKSESVLLKSPGAMQKADSPNEPSKAPVNDQSPSGNEASQGIDFLKKTNNEFAGKKLPSAANYVGKLQNYCVKERFGLPIYSEAEKQVDIKTNLVVFTMSCTVNGVVKWATGTQKQKAKRNAAYKMCCYLGIEKSENETVECTNDKETNSVKTPPIPMPNLLEIDSNLVAQANNLKLEELEEEIFQVSNKIWLYPNLKIGGGGFSEVFKGFKEARESQVAVKRVHQIEAADPKSRELQILLTTKHPNLVLYYFLERKAEYFYFVLELANCNLEEWILFNENDTENLVKVCRDVGLGLKELHKNNIVHRDIKPKNVLIFHSEVTGKIVYAAKLADFGISRILNENEAASAETTQGHLGTQTYLPPEVKPQMTLDLSFDIFPLGILFGFVMTKGKHIFAWPGQTEFYQIRSKISKNKPNWNIINEKQFTSLINLLQVMLSNDPTKRGNMNQILEHPFFWDEKTSFNFVVDVCKEMRNGEACADSICEAAQNYFHYLGDWKVLLDEDIRMWMEEKDSILEKSKKTRNPLRDKWRNYLGGSVKDLISFIRDQDEHYSNWKDSNLEQDKLFGSKYLKEYRLYFMRTFPELSTLLYNVLQNEHYQGKETREKYNHNKGSLFQLNKNSYQELIKAIPINRSERKDLTPETHVANGEQLNQSITPKESPGVFSPIENPTLQQSESEKKQIQIANQEIMLPVIQDQNTCTNCGGRGHSATVCPTGRTSNETRTLDDHLEEYDDYDEDDYPSDSYDQEDLQDEDEQPSDDEDDNEQYLDDLREEHAVDDDDIQENEDDSYEDADTDNGEDAQHCDNDENDEDDHREDVADESSYFDDEPDDEPYDPEDYQDDDDDDEES